MFVVNTKYNCSITIVESSTTQFVTESKIYKLRLYKDAVSESQQPLRLMTDYAGSSSELQLRSNIQSDVALQQELPDSVDSFVLPSGYLPTRISGLRDLNETMDVVRVSPVSEINSDVGVSRVINSIKKPVPDEDLAAVDLEVLGPVMETLRTVGLRLNSESNSIAQANVDIVRRMLSGFHRHRVDLTTALNNHDQIPNINHNDTANPLFSFFDLLMANLPNELIRLGLAAIHTLLSNRVVALYLVLVFFGIVKQFTYFRFFNFTKDSLIDFFVNMLDIYFRDRQRNVAVILNRERLVTDINAVVNDTTVNGQAAVNRLTDQSLTQGLFPNLRRRWGVFSSWMIAPAMCGAVALVKGLMAPREQPPLTVLMLPAPPAGAVVPSNNQNMRDLVGFLIGLGVNGFKTVIKIVRHIK